jgi:hypothetical protein
LATSALALNITLATKLPLACCRSSSSTSPCLPARHYSPLNPPRSSRLRQALTKRELIKMRSIFVLLATTALLTQGLVRAQTEADDDDTSGGSPDAGDDTTATTTTTVGADETVDCSSHLDSDTCEGDTANGCEWDAIASSCAVSANFEITAENCQCLSQNPKRTHEHPNNNGDAQSDMQSWHSSSPCLDFDPRASALPLSVTCRRQTAPM